ncbi:hypothetical protein NC652_014173 [Populus alba x Populus x berolinensis]|nr:hypothetical protein NC652_014173 [Populus alba x Populus x berolinensis]
MEDGQVVPLLQYVVSLAVTEAIKDLCDKNGLPHIDVRIKWPNDLYLNGVNVGGILCTSTYRSQKFNVSAGKNDSSSVICEWFLILTGIGLNVDNEKPTTCLNAVLRELAVSKFFKLLKRHFHHQICHFTIGLCHFELLLTYILWRLGACFKFLPGFQTLE